MYYVEASPKIVACAVSQAGKARMLQEVGLQGFILEQKLQNRAGYYL